MYNHYQFTLNVIGLKKMSNKDLIFALSVIVAILIFTGIIAFAVYEHRRINIETFEATIKDLSEEQKCIHICGFQFESYYDRYKFCLEKCDRISEREANCEEIKYVKNS